jgi:FlaA1/EpsC-like NDP-sugar epimerase
VLDMGEPVRIADVAKRFADQHTPPLRIVYTGLRPGEKLHEELLATDEADERPVHPLISHVPVTPMRLVDAPAMLAAWGLNWVVDTTSPEWSLRQ